MVLVVVKKNNQSESNTAIVFIHVQDGGTTKAGNPHMHGCGGYLPNSVYANRTLIRHTWV